MLSGDNGILQKATDAKTYSERVSVVEQARTDVLGYQAENQGGDLDKSQLKSVLDKYFNEVPDLTNMEKDTILNTELNTLPKYGTHTIAVYEIYNGNIRNNRKKVITFKLTSMYNDTMELTCEEGMTWMEWAEINNEPIYFAAGNSNPQSVSTFNGSLQEFVRSFEPDQEMSIVTGRYTGVILYLNSQKVKPQDEIKDISSGGIYTVIGYYDG